MFRKPHYIALTAVVLLVLILFMLPSGTVAKLKLATGSIFLPLFGLSGAAHQGLEKAGNSVIPRSELVRQNEQLRRENELLRLQAAQAQEIWIQYYSLTNLAARQKQSPWQLKLGRIVSRDPANWWSTVQIDLGSRDGVQPNFPVLSAEGLIGRVSLVGTTRSQVLLLGDPDLRVAAAISETSASPSGRETGVITSDSASAYGNNMVTLKFLSGNSVVKPTHTVITSGDGDVFPSGIPIGRVVMTRSVDYGLTTEASVELFARMNSLERVCVLITTNAVPSALLNPTPVVRPRTTTTARPQQSTTGRPRR